MTEEIFEWPEDTSGGIKPSSPITGEVILDTTSLDTIKLTNLTNGKIPYHVSDAAGLADGPVKTDVDSAVSLKHTQGTDTALGTVGTKSPPIDADKALYRDSTASDALVTSTWTQVKAFLKTYYDTLYNLYVHPNHSGDVTSVADGAQTISAGSVTLAKMANLEQNKIIGRVTASTGVPEALTGANVRTILGTAPFVLGSDADGDMYYRASSVLARLAKGTADYKLFMNAAATAPEWAQGIGYIATSYDLSTDSGDQALSLIHI